MEFTVYFYQTAQTECLFNTAHVLCGEFESSSFSIEHSTILNRIQQCMYDEAYSLKPVSCLLDGAL